MSVLKNDSDVNIRKSPELLYDNLNLNDLISDSEVESYFQEIKEKKLYAFYSDYGEYFLDKKVNATPESVC